MTPQSPIRSPPTRTGSPRSSPASAPAPSPSSAGATLSRPESPGAPGWCHRGTRLSPHPARGTLVGADARSFSATLVGIDSATDLALFRLRDESAVPPVGAGDTGASGSADFAIAVGRSGEGDTVASAGLVNRAGGPWQTWLGGLDRSPDPPRRRHLRRPVGSARRRRSGAVIGDATCGAVAQLRDRRAGGDGLSAWSTHCSRTAASAGPGSASVRRRCPSPMCAGAAAARATRRGLLVTSLAKADRPSALACCIGDIIVRAAGSAAASLSELRRRSAEHIGQAVDARRLARRRSARSAGAGRRVAGRAALPESRADDPGSRLHRLRRSSAPASADGPGRARRLRRRPERGNAR
jgi:hypothetical protein